MPVEQISLTSKIRDYDVFFTLDPRFIAGLKEIPNSIFIVDSMVWQNHREGCLRDLSECDIIVLPVSEDRKNLDTVQELYLQIMQRAPKRNTTVISIGGGITQDITGFMVSTLYRGINWIFVPTTLLAQADSCIGSKTSLNFKNYKNLIGTFYPPSQVYIYTGFLTTQLPLDYFSGLGEVAKLHLMGGEGKINSFQAALPGLVARDQGQLLEVVQSSLTIKQTYITGDEFDTGRRNLLNYGHCFGHAIETATEFGVPHGQAVVIGMMLANVVARNRGLLSAEAERTVSENLLKPVLKAELKTSLVNGDKILDAMKQDKKRTGIGLTLVMLAQGYRLLKAEDIGEQEVYTALNELRDSIK